MQVRYRIQNATFWTSRNGRHTNRFLAEWWANGHKLLRFWLAGVSDLKASSPSRMLQWIMAAMALSMLFICVNEPRIL